MNQSNVKGKYLTQTECILYTGKSQSHFIGSLKHKLAYKQEGKRKYYFLPTKYWDKHHKDEHIDEAILFNADEPEEIDDEKIIDEILTSDLENINNTNKELQEARKKEIVTRTKYLEQKIIDKKHELFAEWSERFFEVFQKSFQKFKNSLIELRLEEDKLNKLNENLDCALKNLEENLNTINNEYIFDKENEDGTT